MTGSRLDPLIDSYAQRANGMTVSEIRALFAVASRPEVVSLAGECRTSRRFPWRRSRAPWPTCWQPAVPRPCSTATAKGDQSLREQITEVMAPVGVHAHPDDIVVTAGSQMALDLVTRIFCDPGDVVLVEAPSYVGAGVFRSYQVDVRHVAMDDKGWSPRR